MSVTTDIMLESLTKLSAHDKLRRWCGRDAAPALAPLETAAAAAAAARGEKSGTIVVGVVVVFVPTEIVRAVLIVSASLVVRRNEAEADRPVE